MSLIQEFKLYLKLRPYISTLQKEFKMKLSWHLAGQILGTAIQGVNAASSVLPEQWKVSIALFVGLAQAVAAIIAHFSQPPTPKDVSNTTGGIV